MNQPEQVAFEKTYNLWQTSAPSANVKHAFREGHDMGWKNAIKDTDTHNTPPATEPLALRLSEGLGPNAQDVARESVDDALMIVASYGPWGADLNDAHRRQIVLADEVHRLRHLYEMAVHGRAEMRAALVPVEPTEAMLNAARDWSLKKYGQAVGNDGARGCYAAMLAAAAIKESQRNYEPS